MDATCALAFTVKHLLQTYPAEKIKNQADNHEVYAAFKEFLRTQPSFQGLSGEVKFIGNDKPNHLSVQQVQNGKSVSVGLMYENSTIDWIGNVVNSSWTQEPEDPPDKFEYWLVFQIGIPVIILCCAISIGVRLGIKRARSLNGGPTTQNSEKKSDDMFSTTADASDATETNNMGNQNETIGQDNELAEKVENLSV